MHLLNVVKKLLILLKIAMVHIMMPHDAPCANQGGWKQKMLGMDNISFETMLNCVKGVG